MATADLERLYAVPPTEFTVTRNRLVAELRKAGRRAEAQAAAKLRKPSAALWAVNRLARTDRQELARFVDAVERLRRAQLRDPRTAADALRAQRGALETLVARAQAQLEGAGLAASPATLRRIGDTLLGAAVDRDQVAALRRGTLTEELPAPGFEALSGARVGPPLRLVRPSDRPRARDEPHDDARRDDEAGRRADEAARRAEDVARREEEAARRRRETEEAERLEREAREHELTVERLEAERAAARARLADLARALDAARRRAREARAAARRVRRKTKR